MLWQTIAWLYTITLDWATVLTLINLPLLGLLCELNTWNKISVLMVLDILQVIFLLHSNAFSQWPYMYGTT